METPAPVKLLFIINPSAGNGIIDWSSEIDLFFATRPYRIEKILLKPGASTGDIKIKILAANAHKVIAAGGDGTVKLVAECLLHTNTIMGILPAGSANGLAGELGIPASVQGALQFLLRTESRKIHVVSINGQLCIHLSDIGFNASVIKIFEAGRQRGMAGYIKAAWKVLWKHAAMQATIRIDNNYIRREAAMIVIANATRYGSGAVINPAGRLDDDLFEVVIIRKVSFSEIFKMMVTHQPYDKAKTELYQAQSLQITSKKKAHFQIDGEYLGKVSKIQAFIITDALNIIS